MSKYLKFKQGDTHTKQKDTHTVIFNKKSGEFLGTIYFYKQWKKWVFDSDDAFFDAECLNEIVDYMKKLPKPD